MIDFNPLEAGDKKYIDLWREENITIDDLRNSTNESIDRMLELLVDLDDADIVVNPHDPEANDPYAVEGEEHIGWNLAHLIAHVTASSEEGAAFSSLLARGVEEVKDRPRYETPWTSITSKSQCIQRLEESRRMRLAYLDTWPDTPHYDVNRLAKTERFTQYFGDLNAPATFLMGLRHEVEHYEQMVEVRQQALKAKQTRAGV